MLRDPGGAEQADTGRLPAPSLLIMLLSVPPMTYGRSLESRLLSNMA
jgi:hypothetical protein